MPIGMSAIFYATKNNYRKSVLTLKQWDSNSLIRYPEIFCLTVKHQLLFIFSRFIPNSTLKRFSEKCLFINYKFFITTIQVPRERTLCSFLSVVNSFKSKPKITCFLEKIHKRSKWSKSPQRTTLDKIVDTKRDWKKFFNRSFCSNSKMNISETDATQKMGHC